MAQREPLSRVDAAWLHMDRPENTADIVALLELDGLLSPSRLERLLRTRLLALHPRFRQRVVERAGHPGWERDPRFTLRRHLSRRTLPAAERSKLAGLLDEIVTEELPAGRPPWKVVLVASGARTLVIVKLHHCIADGFALVSLLLGLSDEAAGRRTRAGDPSPAPGLLASLARALPEGAILGRAPLASARSLWRMVSLDATDGPLRPRPLSGVRRVAWSGSWPLREVRTAARAAGATVNDVLLAALAGALRRRLHALHPLVEARDVRALIPVNLRPRLPIAGAPGALGNRFGLVFADLPVAAEDPATRLALAHARLSASRRSPDALVTLAVLGALGLAPARLERLGTTFFSRKATLVVTNVPGPRRRLHLAGRRVDRMHFWVPHPATLGIGVSLLSYGGQLTVGVRADAAVLPDPAALVEAFEAELASLAPGAVPHRRWREEAPAAETRPGPEVRRGPTCGPRAEATSPAS